MINLVGAGPTSTGTSGAPGGKLPFRATHGLPAAEPAGVEVAGVVVVVALFELEPHAEATAMSAVATITRRAFVRH
jgi:hypothetical protein